MLTGQSFEGHSQVLDNISTITVGQALSASIVDDTIFDRSRTSQCPLWRRTGADGTAAMGVER
jgi:hypothetical protein